LEKASIYAGFREAAFIHTFFQLNRLQYEKTRQMRRAFFMPGSR
jgi:hypothetical protein